jgi:hypothetical protein
MNFILVSIEVRCHRCLIQPHVLPLNLTSILILLSQLPWQNLTNIHFLHSNYHNSRPFSVVYIVFQIMFAGPRLHVILRNKLYFLRWPFVSTTPNPRAGEPPLSADRYCVFNIYVLNQRTLHAVVTKNPPYMGY